MHCCGSHDYNLFSVIAIPLGVQEREYFSMATGHHDWHIKHQLVPVATIQGVDLA